MLAELGAGPEAKHLASILLVEDEILIRSILAEELRGYGLGVVEAANADEAWAYLQAGGAPDLVFSDIRMPGSMDGLELLKRVKEHYPTIKIIMTSGNPGPRSMAALGLFLQKPYRFAHAAEVTLELLGLPLEDADE